jgi:hypothetical protein
VTTGWLGVSTAAKVGKPDGGGSFATAGGLEGATTVSRTGNPSGGTRFKLADDGGIVGAGSSGGGEGKSMGIGTTVGNSAGPLGTAGVGFVEGEVVGCSRGSTGR